MVPTVQWYEGAVRLLDQSRLPETVAFLDCRNVESVALAIRELKVRGAPAIGVTAAMGVALGAQSIPATEYEPFSQALLAICGQLAATRPTAVNLFWAIERMKRKLSSLQGESVAAITPESPSLRSVLGLGRCAPSCGRAPGGARGSNH